MKKMKMLLLAVASVMSSVLSTQGKRVMYVIHIINYVYVCMHITNYVASDPCFRSASACIGC